MIAPGSAIHFRDALDRLRPARFVRMEGDWAIIEFASGDDGIDRTSVCKLAEIHDPVEERIRNQAAHLLGSLQLERERHQAAIEAIEARLAVVQQECRDRGHGLLIDGECATCGRKVLVYEPLEGAR